MPYCPFRHFPHPVAQVGFVRLACLIHAANVRSEPGSNPSKKTPSTRTEVLPFHPRLLPDIPALALGACLKEGGEKSASKSLRSPYLVDSKFTERRSPRLTGTAAGKFVQRQ